MIGVDWTRLLTACVALIALPGLAAQPPNADSIMRCAADNGPEKTFSQTLVFTTSDSTGETREITTRLLGQREAEGVQLNLKILNPINLAGTAFLIQEQAGQDAMHIYVPSMQRTRRITGSMAARDLWGTSFSYLDLKQVFGAFVEGGRSLLPPAKLDGIDVHTVKVIPAQDEGAPFAALRAMIDQQNCVTLGVDFVDIEGNLLKTLRADPRSIQAIGKRHLASRYLMTDLLTASSTEVVLGEIEFDEKIDRNAFRSRGFER